MYEGQAEGDNFVTVVPVHFSLASSILFALAPDRPVFENAYLDSNHRQAG